MILSDQEKKQPICFHCAKELRLQFDSVIPEQNMWNDTCEFCGLEKFVFLPTEASNL